MDTNGELSEDESVGHKRLWKRMPKWLGVPRFDSDAGCVYVTLADADDLIDRLNTQLPLYGVRTGRPVAWGPS